MNNPETDPDKPYVSIHIPEEARTPQYVDGELRWVVLPDFEEFHGADFRITRYVIRWFNEDGPALEDWVYTRGKEISDLLGSNVIRGHQWVGASISTFYDYPGVKRLDGIGILLTGEDELGNVYEFRGYSPLDEVKETPTPSPSPTPTPKPTASPNARTREWFMSNPETGSGQPYVSISIPEDARTPIRSAGFTGWDLKVSFEETHGAELTITQYFVRWFTEDDIELDYIFTPAEDGFTDLRGASVIEGFRQFSAAFMMDYQLPDTKPVNGVGICLTGTDSQGNTYEFRTYSPLYALDNSPAPDPSPTPAPAETRSGAAATTSPDAQTREWFMSNPETAPDQPYISIFIPESARTPKDEWGSFGWHFNPSFEEQHGVEFTITRSTVRWFNEYGTAIPDWISTTEKEFQDFFGIVKFAGHQQVFTGIGIQYDPDLNGVGICVTGTDAQGNIYEFRGDSPLDPAE